MRTVPTKGSGCAVLMGAQRFLSCTELAKSMLQGMRPRSSNSSEDIEDTFQQKVMFSNEVSLDNPDRAAIPNVSSTSHGEISVTSSSWNQQD